MLSNDPTTLNRQSRSFAQEMKQTFDDWVRHLPFLKSAFPQREEQEYPEEKSSDQAPASHPTAGALAGQSPEAEK